MNAQIKTVLVLAVVVSFTGACAGATAGDDAGAAGGGTAGAGGGDGGDGGAAASCSAATCAGCCTPTGRCETGYSNAQCGAGGNQCLACATGLTCSVGVCVYAGQGGGGATGGGGGGGGATGGGGGATGGGGGATGGGGGATSSSGPVVFYTDIVSGPNSGGEGNQGAYLSIFGAGFGASRGGSRVTIGGVEVGAYKLWSDNRVTVQPGPGVSGGAIAVAVGAATSPLTTSFTVRPGQIFFVAQSGSDTAGVVGDITRPFRNVQTTFDRSDFGPGDHLVIRAGTWTDTNARYDSFFSLQDGKGGTATDAVVLMAYPGELVRVPRGGHSHGIHGWNTPGGLTVCGLQIDMQGTDGTPFGFPPGAAGSFGNTMQNMRAVNNELTGMVAYGGGSAAMEGRGRHFKYLGNRIHDNGGSKLYHGIYFDDNDGTGTDDVELAWNTIFNQTGGRGIQIYNSGSAGITNVNVHHNVIHDIALDGILFGDSTEGGMWAWNNVVYRTAVPSLQTDGFGGGCLRLNNTATVARVLNNTFYQCATDGNPDSAALRLDRLAPNGLTLVNNLVSTTGGGGYLVGSTTGRVSASSNNLWYGAGVAPSWDSQSAAGDPLFVDAASGQLWVASAASPAVDHGSSSVSALVTDDLVGAPRPQGAAFDIGAFERAP